jgi:hypothetical protein
MKYAIPLVMLVYMRWDGIVFPGFVIYNITERYGGGRTADH